MLLNFIKDRVNRSKSFQELDKIINQLAINNKVNKIYLYPIVNHVLKRIYNKSLFIDMYNIDKDLYINVTIPISKNKGKDIQLNEITYMFSNINIE